MSFVSRQWNRFWLIQEMRWLGMTLPDARPAIKQIVAKYRAETMGPVDDLLDEINYTVKSCHAIWVLMPCVWKAFMIWNCIPTVAFLKNRYLAEFRRAVEICPEIEETLEEVDREEEEKYRA